MDQIDYIRKQFYALNAHSLCGIAIKNLPISKTTSMLKFGELFSIFWLNMYNRWCQEYNSLASYFEKFENITPGQTGCILG